MSDTKLQIQNWPTKFWIIHLKLCFHRLEILYKKLDELRDFKEKSIYINDEYDYEKRLKNLITEACIQKDIVAKKISKIIC